MAAQHILSSGTLSCVSYALQLGIRRLDQRSRRCACMSRTLAICKVRGHCCWLDEWQRHRHFCHDFISGLLLMLLCRCSPGRCRLRRIRHPTGRQLLRLLCQRCLGQSAARTPWHRSTHTFQLVLRQHALGRAPARRLRPASAPRSQRLFRTPCRRFVSTDALEQVLTPQKVSGQAYGRPQAAADSAPVGAGTTRRGAGPLQLRGQRTLAEGARPARAPAQQVCRQVRLSLDSVCIASLWRLCTGMQSGNNQLHKREGQTLEGTKLLLRQAHPTRSGKACAQAGAMPTLVPW